MSYELMRFTHEVNEEFHCFICTMILKDAMQSPCEHLFCNECIKGWLAVDQSCPVERAPLQLEDMKPVMKAFRNIMNKFEIKCDFESKGCEAVVKLENLEDHNGRCKYNRNAKVFCDKGCDIEMRRHEYETNDCIKHLADQAFHQNEKMVKLEGEMASLRIQQEKAVNEMNRQNDTIATLNGEVNSKSKEIHRLRSQIEQFGSSAFDSSAFDSSTSGSSASGSSAFGSSAFGSSTFGSSTFSSSSFQNVLNSNEEDISKSSNEISIAANYLVNEQYEFRLWADIKISIDQPYVLEVDNGWGYAQSVYSLEQTNFSFEIEILCLGDWIAVGLTPMCPSECVPSFGDGTAFYGSNGNFFIDGRCEYSGLRWRVGDIIEYGINIPSDFVNGDRVQVYCNKNGELIREGFVEMPIYGFFPTVSMEKNSKIKF